ncbi:MAG TPA: class I SAM-dependent methyltransferase [Nocardioides sp.]|uniref:class I SAM-dependent methyltransferase n=1 Tax=Nocardioides sp. TaxID=35761 RepID=UPI002E33970A|nr:class I SAM-dependent methyltransferase [Nocardioides sp.]HEX5088456.1 class I SAM-dependent methyltransferase [Nocardioides sp.]
MDREDYVQRMGAAVLGAFDIASTYLGVRLGFYQSLADEGPATAAELAARTGTNERLVREWLEQQGANELLDARNDAGEWRFGLPADHAAVLLDPDALDGVAGTVLSVVADLAQVPRLVGSFRTGEGIPYADYGPDEAEGQARGTRPVYRAELESWLAAVPDLSARLATGGARVLDIGCGLGWSSVAMAKAHPGLVVDGVDLDPGSIAAAKEVAESEGVADRVRFEVRDAATLAGAGYDLATMFEMLHDLARPVDVLRAAREALGPGGVVLVADEPCAEAFVGPADEEERRYYGYSLLHCLPASMAEPGSAATGTVIRPDTVRRYAGDAGFSAVEVLPVESVAFRLYLLRP